MKSGFVGVLLLTTLTVAGPALAAPEDPDRDSGRDLWQQVDGPPRPVSPGGARPAVRPRRFRTFTLDRAGMAERLAAAPYERSLVAREHPLVLALPAPDGRFQRFAVQESPIMEPELAARHPEIKTYGGRGIDNPAATIRLDLTPLGFHASIRGPGGAWYVDPYYHLDQTLYVSYYRRDLPKDARGTFVERESDALDLSVDGGRYRATDTVQLQGRGFAAGARIIVTVSDPADRVAPRTVEAVADAKGAFEASFVAGAEGGLDSYFVEATDGTLSATTGLPHRERGGAFLRSRRRRSAPDLSARPHHRPRLLDLLRRSRERDRGQGHPDQPGGPDLRGRDLGPDGAGRQQRPPQPRHRRPCDGSERSLRDRGLLHRRPGRHLQQPQPDPDRHRPDHRGGQLRHRPPRPGRERGRGGEPGGGGTQPESAGLHGRDHARGRLLRRRLRGPRDGPSVCGEPSVQRYPVELLRRQPQRGELGGAGERILDHGLRGHLRVGRPAAAQRSLLVPAQLPGDRDVRDVEPGRDQRGPDGLPPELRHQRRLVHPELQRERLGSHRPRDQLHRGGDPGRDPGGSPAGPEAPSPSRTSAEGEPRATTASR